MQGEFWVVAENFLLVDRLIGSRAVQFAGTIGREQQQWHLFHTGFNDGRECIGNSGSRGADKNAGSPSRLSESQGGVGQSAFVEMLNYFCVRLPSNGKRQRRTPGTGCDEKMINANIQAGFYDRVGPNAVDQCNVP